VVHRGYIRASILAYRVACGQVPIRDHSAVFALMTVSL